MVDIWPAVYRRNHSPSRLAWFEGRGCLALPYIRQMNRVNSCSDLCHDDSTINIVLVLLL